MNSQSQNRRRLLIAALAFLFAAPLLIALVLRVGGWQPGATGNHGILIEPPVRLPSGAVPADLRDRWVLVAHVSYSCRGDCMELADKLLRVRRALGRDGRRVALLLSGPERLPAELGASPLAIAPESLRRAVEGEVADPGPGSVEIIDPRGYLMMRYDPGFSSSDLLEDLERLLRYDHVGVQT